MRGIVVRQRRGGVTPYRGRRGREDGRRRAAGDVRGGEGGVGIG